MRRTDLEKKLKALGWIPVAASVRNHTAWIKVGGMIIVPNYDIIHDSVAERILADAEEV